MTPSLPPATWPCLRFTQHSGEARVVIDISVSPNAKRTELVGWHDGALRVRLAAPPVEGAANEALKRWLATELKVPQQQVSLLRGDTSRRKQYAIDAPPALVTDWLSRQSTLK